MKTLKVAALLFLAGSIVVACGGSDGPSPYTKTSSSTGGGGAGSTATAVSMALALSSSVVTASSPATVTATVSDASGNPVPDQLVAFTTRLGLGAVSPATSLTNASGQAVGSLAPASNSSVGADEVIASATVSGTAVTATRGFQLTASNVTISAFASDLAGAALSAYGQTTLTATLAGAVAGVPVTVGVSSACVTAGKATLTPSSATTNNGTTSFTFKDLGCGAGSVSETLQATITGTTATRALTVPLTSPAASSIVFVSATPSTIYLKGSGFTETSTVTFRVVDVSGNALAGQSVSMIATTYTGGLTLDAVSTAVTKTTDSNGNVAVIVNSGTVPTPVRVRATLVGSAIATSSSNLSITVGLPSQSAFSLAQQTLNIEGFDRDGTTNTYTIFASDRMSNPVPAGTAINFVAEGGQIVGSGQISLAGGIASSTVNFVSASPRPADGRITVVAYALGEESFVDTNGDNIFNSGEQFQDLGDVFVSRTYDFAAGFDVVNDQRIPQTLTGTPAACVNASTASAASALLALDISLPSVPTFAGANRCDGVWGQAFVRRATETVLSTSASSPVWFPGSEPSSPGSPGAPISLRNSPVVSALPVTYFKVGGSSVTVDGAIGSLSFIVRDTNPVRLNPVAAGSTIAVDATTGLTVKVTGGSPVPNTTNATLAAISYEFNQTTSNGTINLHITSPAGLTSNISFGISKAGGAGTTGTAASMTLALSSNVVTASSPAIVTATVINGSGNPVPDQVVAFSTRLGLGSVSPATSLTNASGQAVATLAPASNSSVGADDLLASATVSGTALAATRGFQLTATNVTISAFASDLAGAPLNSYGQTTLTATLAGAVPGAPVTVGVSSACVAAGKATLTPSSATTTSGTALFTFRDLGCGTGVASDTVQATITGTTATRALIVPLTSPAASSIVFVSATPPTIYLKGSGFTETSTVTFKVVDVSGNSLPGQSVSMIATTYTGGLTLDAVSTAVVKTTDSNGNVAVIVNSGTVPTPVRVRATLVGSAIATSSSNLSITVGLPTQNAFSLSQKTFNIEGFNLDGTTNTYTVFASDRMSNPVPAGTAINFVSEGGQIVGSGQISLAGGIASSTANFVSASPRPDDGRITVVAYALGEESFVDTNGDNIFNSAEQFQDLGDVFISRTFDFAAGFDVVNDQRIPQTLTGIAAVCVNASTASAASALLALDISLPSVPTFAGAPRCDGVWGQAFVRRAVETVLSMSTSSPVWVPGSVPGSPGASINLRNTPVVSAPPVTYFKVGGSSVTAAGVSGSLSFIVRDTNSVRLNPVAFGSTITAQATTGLSVAVVSGSPVANTISATLVTISYAFGTGTLSGTITLHIASPSGVVSDISFDISP